MQAKYSRFKPNNERKEMKAIVAHVINTYIVSEMQKEPLFNKHCMDTTIVYEVKDGFYIMEWVSFGEGYSTCISQCDNEQNARLYEITNKQ